MWIFRVADFFFLVFHMAIVILNLFGWIWKPTRKACLIVQVLTAASWFGLGLIYGIGFCPFTEWHWRVLERLGERPQETSYIQYLVRRVFDLHVPAALVADVTVVLFFIAVIASVIVNIRDSHKV
ncbi:MAG TPA: DUF2784 domain-containing protein [Bacteroidales bacterium]|nr:DUF2784 domain-containing protein [Bacteroidales bacterium]